MRDEILGLLTEDYYGLWELQVQLATERARTAPVVQELLDSGLIAWFYRAADGEHATPTDANFEYRPDLGDDVLWQVPLPADAQWLLGATAQGDDAYFQTDE